MLSNNCDKRSKGNQHKGENYEITCQKGGYKEKRMKGTPTSKYTPILSCPQMNSSDPFMNHQNARLIFALGEAAGREFSESICSSAGNLLNSSSNQSGNSNFNHQIPMKQQNQQRTDPSNKYRLCRQKPGILWLFPLCHRPPLLSKNN